MDGARRDVDRLDRPTRRQRDQLAAADDDVDDAKLAHRLAVHRLDTSGIGGRRHARRDLAAAQNRLTWANHTLDQLQQHTSPDLDRYHQASRQLHDLGDALRSHDTRELLDRYTTTDRIPELQERLDALDAWWRFANGDTIDATRLGELVDVLGNVTGDHAERYELLADAVGRFCRDAGINLPTFEPVALGLERSGLDIGL